MISAGFLPACTAPWHRAVLELVRAGWWRDLPGVDRMPPAVWLAVPAAVVAALAITCAATSRARAFLVVLGLTALIHPWLVIALAPLALMIRAWPAPSSLGAPAAVSVLGAALGWWLTPACASPATAVTPMQLAGAWGTSLGLAGLALLLLDALFGQGRRSQLVTMTVLVVSAVLLARARVTDATALIGASAAMLWWRAAAGAGLVVAWQTSAAGRVGAVLLVALVPALQVARADTARPKGPEPDTLDAWGALQAAGSPAVVITTGGPIDVATTIWRSGPSEAQRSLISIPPEPDATSRYLATSAVYAWRSVARTLAMRGMLVAPMGATGQPEPLLWRVLQFERCRPLTAAWVDAGSVAAGGQIAGVFPAAEPNRGALVYLASERPLQPRPLDWPPESVPGLSARAFDRRSSAGQAALQDAMQRDELGPDALGTSRYVTRLRFDRRGTAPETLTVTLDGTATATWARVYASSDPRPDRQPSICRSSVGQPVTSYAGAPAVIPVDMTSAAFGGGWHGPEQVGGDRFRWTAEPEAEVLFIAQQPQPLVLRLDAQPGTGDWATAGMRVSLNGTEARCHAGAPPCDWLLPAEAMRTGLNLLTLQSETVPAPAPETRRLGLLVRRLELARP